MKKLVAVTTFSLTVVFACLNVAAQSREDILKEVQAKHAELKVLEQKILDVSDADREANAAFLGGSDTGIIRLLPRDKHKLLMSGNGGYYSFIRSTHEYGYGSDISLDSGMLSVGFAGFQYGLLLNVGDIALEEVTSHRAVRALLDYTPPTKEADIRHQQQQVYQGIELSGFNFKSRLSARLSNTYLLRSISPERSDIAVVFRIVREDTDGSFILVFKVLKKFPTPDVERTKTANN